MCQILCAIFAGNSMLDVRTRRNAGANGYPWHITDARNFVNNGVSFSLYFFIIIILIFFFNVESGADLLRCP